MRGSLSIICLSLVVMGGWLEAVPANAQVNRDESSRPEQRRVRIREPFADPITPEVVELGEEGGITSGAGEAETNLAGCLPGGTDQGLWTAQEPTNLRLIYSQSMGLELEPSQETEDYFPAPLTLDSDGQLLLQNSPDFQAWQVDSKVIPLKCSAAGAAVAAAASGSTGGGGLMMAGLPALGGVGTALAGNAGNGGGVLSASSIAPSGNSPTGAPTPSMMGGALVMGMGTLLKKWQAQRRSQAHD